MTNPLARKRILAENEHVLAIEQDLGGSALVITFNSVTRLRSGLGFWGDDFLLRQGISSIGIMTSRANWYPPAAMEEILPAIVEATRGRRVVTYGHSQGGYGALKFASKLNASVVLSFSPQWSIRPSDLGGHDTRFTEFHDATLDNGNRIVQEDIRDNAFIFFDPMEPHDRYNAQKLLSLRGVRGIISRFSMHQSVRVVAQGRGASKLLRLCLDTPTPSPPELRQIVRGCRRASHTYADHRFAHIIKRARAQIVVPSLFSSRELQNHQKHRGIYSSCVAFVDGEIARAESELRSVSDKELNAFGLFELWTLFRSVRFTVGELAVSRLLCADSGARTIQRLLAVNTFITAGNEELAAKELEFLTVRDDARDHIGHFITFAGQLRRPDLLETFLTQTTVLPERISLLFAMVTLYQTLGDRSKLFRTLRELAALCHQSDKDLSLVATHLFQIGELTFALELRTLISKRQPGNPAATLDVIEAQIPLDKKKAKSMLDNLCSEDAMPSLCWERASIMYARFGERMAAVESLHKAVALPDVTWRARERFVKLLLKQRKVNSARAELAALIHTPSESPALRIFADLALQIPDRNLALKFAEADQQLNLRSPDSIVHLAKYARIVGDSNRAQTLLAGMFITQRRIGLMSAHQWVALAEELSNCGQRVMAKDAARQALSIKPNHRAASETLRKMYLLEKFGRRRPIGSAEDSNNVRRRGRWLKTLREWLAYSSVHR